MLNAFIGMYMYM